MRRSLWRGSTSGLLFTIMAPLGGATSPPPPPPPPLPLHIDLIAIVDGGLSAVDASNYAVRLATMTSLTADRIAVSGGNGGIVTASLDVDAGSGIETMLRGASIDSLQQAIGANFTGGAHPLVAHWTGARPAPASPASCGHTAWGFIGSGPFGFGDTGYTLIGIIAGVCGILWCLACCLCLRSIRCKGDEGSSEPNPLLAKNGQGSGKTGVSWKFQKSSAAPLSSKKSADSKRSEYLGHSLELETGASFGGGVGARTNSVEIPSSSIRPNSICSSEGIPTAVAAI